MKNEPLFIYLQLSDSDYKFEKDEDFKEYDKGSITWNDEPIWKNDLKFINYKTYLKAVRNLKKKLKGD